MTTTVTLTGTGVPHAAAGRAGPGALVRCDSVALQFDAGRATVLRLAEAGTSCGELDAVFLTHLHSDHVVAAADLAITRWVESLLHPAGPLRVVCPRGGPARFVERMLEPYEDDIAIRMAHVQPEPPAVDLAPFDPTPTPAEVWRSDDGAVRVSAVAVHHEPVPDAVAYRVDTTDGSVVISGDTRVCDEVAMLAIGADVVVHEAARTRAMAPLVDGTPFGSIFRYHADSVALGAQAAAIGVPHLVLTHLIPSPSTDEERDAFVADVRAGGFDGVVTVGEDLDVIDVRNRPG